MMNVVKMACVLVVAAFVFTAGCSKKHVAAQSVTPLAQEAITSVINVPNANGSITPVVIKRYGNQWVGPKGEIYNSYPTVDQLKPMYGM